MVSLAGLSLVFQGSTLEPGGGKEVKAVFYSAIMEPKGVTSWCFQELQLCEGCNREKGNSVIQKLF